MTGLPTEFSLENVRCFQNHQSAQLRPITLLVGENSTGKSSFLGCYSVLYRMFGRGRLRQEKPDFNEVPFPMGSFREIVRAQRGPAGRIHEFKLGIAFEGVDNEIKRVIVSFTQDGSQPDVSALRYTMNDDFLELRRDPSGSLELLFPNHKEIINIPAELLFEAMMYLGRDRIRSRSNKNSTSVKYIKEFTERWFRGDNKPRYSRELTDLTPRNLVPSAPLRAQPKRTYDPIRETASPEGEHVPMLMMRLTRSDDAKWKRLHDQLVSFGTESDLFSDIKVKGHGRDLSDPFQLQVKARSGSHQNIMDVGYGVNQSLPILVDVLLANNSQFILQQPEVHLHPRGQAELASFFIDSVHRSGNSFLIETHSDFIIDRVRIAVRQQKFNAKDVSIIYFEPKRNTVNLHSMTLDDNGNLNDVPKGYREFFVRETDRLLGFAD